MDFIQNPQEAENNSTEPGQGASANDLAAVVGNIQYQENELSDQSSLILVSSARPGESTILTSMNDGLDSSESRTNNSDLQMGNGPGPAQPISIGTVAVRANTNRKILCSNRQYNMRSAGVKRLLREAQELINDPNYEFRTEPLDDNLFEWHFTIRGPPATNYSQGLYHGRIIFPTDYPLKPPSIIMLTPSGRFETGVKICLSISSYHPETWRPSWSIRTALLALITFMENDSPGAIGSLEYSAEDRRNLARRSVTWECPTCGPIVKHIENFPAAADADTEEDINHYPSNSQRVFRLPSSESENIGRTESNPIPRERPFQEEPLRLNPGLMGQGDRNANDLMLPAEEMAGNMNNADTGDDQEQGFSVFTIVIGGIFATIVALLVRRIYMTTGYL